MGDWSEEEGWEEAMEDVMLQIEASAVEQQAREPPGHTYCIACCKSFSTYRGLQMHTSRMHSVLISKSITISYLSECCWISCGKLIPRGFGEGFFYKFYLLIP